MKKTILLFLLWVPPLASANDQLHLPVSAGATLLEGRLLYAAGLNKDDAAFVSFVSVNALGFVKEKFLDRRVSGKDLSNNLYRLCL